MQHIVFAVTEKEFDMAGKSGIRLVTPNSRCQIQCTYWETTETQNVPRKYTFIFYCRTTALLKVYLQVEHSMQKTQINTSSPV